MKKNDIIEWTHIAQLEQLPPGERIVIGLDDVRVLVTNVAGKIYAVESLCSHAMFDLDDAEIVDESIVCPLHGAHFCLKTGKVQSPPAYEDLAIFAVKIENNQIFIADTR